MSRREDRTEREAVLAERSEFMVWLCAHPGEWREVDPRFGVVAGPYTHAQAVVSGVVPDAGYFELYQAGNPTDDSPRGTLWMRRKPRPEGVPAQAKGDGDADS